MQSKLQELASEGFAVFALSYDSVETLAAFARDYGITYPLLSDSDSSFIRELGIFNDTVALDSRSYGVPWPGTYVVDVDGTVTSKVFHESNYVRDATSTSLREQLGIDLSEGPSAEWTGDRLSVAILLDTDVFVRQRRIGWRARIALAEDMHIYGTPVPDGFIPTQLSVEVPDGVRVVGPNYPNPSWIDVSFMDATVPIHSGVIEITGALVFEDIREDVEVAFTLHYQTCTDDECFAPEDVRLAVPVTYEPFA